MTWVEGLINIVKLFCFVFATGIFLYLAYTYWRFSSLTQRNKLKIKLNEIDLSVKSKSLDDLVKLNNESRIKPPDDPDKAS